MFYDYVLTLKQKEHEAVTFDHFKVVHLLGEGGFGQVLEVCRVPLHECRPVHATPSTLSGLSHRWLAPRHKRCVPTRSELSRRATTRRWSSAIAASITR